MSQHAASTPTKCGYDLSTEYTLYHNSTSTVFGPWRPPNEACIAKLAAIAAYHRLAVQRNGQFVPRNEARIHQRSARQKAHHRQQQHCANDSDRVSNLRRDFDKINNRRNQQRQNGKHKKSDIRSNHHFAAASKRVTPHHAPRAVRHVGKVILKLLNDRQQRHQLRYDVRC